MSIWRCFSQGCSAYKSLRVVDLSWLAVYFLDCQCDGHFGWSPDMEMFPLDDFACCRG